MKLRKEAKIKTGETVVLRSLCAADTQEAIHLYKRFGFVEFGRHPQMMKYRDGTYADAILMALDLRAKR